MTRVAVTDGGGRGWGMGGGGRRRVGVVVMVRCHFPKGGIFGEKLFSRPVWLNFLIMLERRC